MPRVTISIFICLLFSCTDKSPSEDSLSATDQFRYEQYFVRGKELYKTHCNNCHQDNGEGLGKLFPPIKDSDYMTHNFNKVVCLIKNGIRDSIEVNGIIYNQPMPGASQLTDLEVAEITTFIYNTWGHDRGFIKVKQVSAILQQCNVSQE